MTGVDDGQTLDDVQSVDAIHRHVESIRREVHQAIVGQRSVVDQLLITVFGGGHALVVGVPGLAKTMVIQALARTLSLEFRRIQFTPDLMPADITGTEIIQEDRLTGRRELKFVPGPVFGNIVLADEINRTPPKTQAALLEAMQERQVSVGGQQHRVPQPFFVLATQNPIEQEGTYPLPEAQLDRFMLQINMDYPDEADELEIIQRTQRDRLEEVGPVLDGERLQDFIRRVTRIPIGDPVVHLALALIRGTRPTSPTAPDFIRQYVAWGVGPRAGQALVTAAKARAAIHGRILATRSDLESVVLPVLAHRLRLNFTAEADEVTAAQILNRLIEHVSAREDHSDADTAIPVLRSRAGR